MPVRAIDILKNYFRSGNKPSQIWWNNFFDSLAEIERQAIIAFNINGPIIYVTDEAHRLLIGPATTIGRMVQQLDTGVTYVKQQQPGSNLIDWTEIGDAQITIPDVNGLQDELNALLLNDTDDQADVFIGAANFHQPGPVVEVAAVDLGATERVDMNLDTGYSMIYASVTKDFSLAMSATNPTTTAMTQTLMAFNSGGASVACSLPADTATAWYILINGIAPMVVSSGKFLTLAVQSVPVPPSAPGYGGAGHMAYFVTYGLQT